jgi:uncharacterized DUF497 family protein
MEERALIIVIFQFLDGFIRILSIRKITKTYEKTLNVAFNSRITTK